MSLQENRPPRVSTWSEADVFIRVDDGRVRRRVKEWLASGAARRLPPSQLGINCAMQCSLDLADVAPILERLRGRHR